MRSAGARAQKLPFSGTSPPPTSPLAPTSSEATVSAPAHAHAHTHADDEPPDPAYSELRAERAQLARSRSCLADMREHTRSLTALAGDGFAAESLAASIERRVASLADDGTTPPFFGRIDSRVDGHPSPDTTETTEAFHIGRRHVHDDRGDPVVVDWRADVATPFYRATAANPMGVVRRRRFGFSDGELTAYEDEQLAVGDDAGTGSRILQEEIERPRVGPMRDIVATIQPDQDEIVRSELSRTVCVQGAPGTGKTAVGLHRAAYLLYACREQLRRSGVLVVGPNRTFLGYIGEVLPALGELAVQQRSVDDLVAHVVPRATDPPAVARLKGDSRLAAVIARAVDGHLRAPQEPVVLPQGSRRWRVGTAALSDIVTDLHAHGLRYHAARAALPMRVADAILRQLEAAGDAPDDRVLDRVARSRPVRAFVDAVWPRLDAASVVFRLLSDPTFLAAAADGLLDTDEQRLLLWSTPARSARTTHWSVADAYCVDEAADLLDRTASFGHVILDEAQDLSPMQLRALARRCSTGSATVLGDLAQGTTPWAAESWADVLAHLGKPDAAIEVLTKGYRVPRELIDYANRLLPHIAADVAAAVSVRTAAGSLAVRRVSSERLDAEVAATTRLAAADGGSVAVIAADAAVPDALAALRAAGLEPHDLRSDDSAGRLAVVPATLAKGLEFDHVVVVEPAAIVAAEPRGLRRLYVVLTRAVSALTVVHAHPLPAPLR